MVKIKTPHINKVLNDIGKAAITALLNHNQGSDLNSNIKYNIKSGLLSFSLPGYATFVDEGTKPHMPPIDSIIKWANARGLNAWAVAKGIEKWGTKPQPFLYEINDTIIKSENKLADAGVNDIVPVTDAFFKKTGGTIK